MTISSKENCNVELEHVSVLCLVSQRGWAAPPPPPSYQNVWSGGDLQPPSYEEALLDTETHPLQAAAPPVTASSGFNPFYAPVPGYQPPGPYPPVPDYKPSGSNPPRHGYQAPGPYPPVSGYQAPGPYPPVPGYQPSGSSSLPRPQRRDSLEAQCVMSNEELMAWWRTVKPWEKMSQSPDTELRMLAKKVHRVQRAVQLYRLLMSTHGVTLQNHIGEITPAPTTSARPTAAGGLTKASIKNKVAIDHDKRVLGALVQDYRKKLEDMESCLQFIYTGMEHIGRNHLSILKGVDMDTSRVASMLGLSGEVALGLGAAGSRLTSSKGSQGASFAMSMDICFSKEDQEQLKKGSETKFARKIRELSKQLKSGLDQLMQFRDTVCSDVQQVAM
ncbi:uncharacterized protein LOC143119443 [Alosa pseudoharengus]|uniref:uncharacterized protein LOC143119443 n=1 Tax=Alosa pseudoharengus TaxID=34774 RepID=UPI003F8C955B